MIWFIDKNMKKNCFDKDFLVSLEKVKVHGSENFHFILYTSENEKFFLTEEVFEELKKLGEEYEIMVKDDYNSLWFIDENGIEKHVRKELIKSFQKEKVYGTNEFQFVLYVERNDMFILTEKAFNESKISLNS